MQDFIPNFCLETDSYKLTHAPQYPKGTEIVFSYLESRGGMFANTAMAGYLYYLKRYFEGKVFDMTMVEEARYFAIQHFGNDYCFNYAGWKRLYEKWGGVLPLRIRAVPEGAVVPTHNVLMTIENTDPEFGWLTNFAETKALKIWYPITVCTLSRAIKQVIGKALVRTGEPNLLPFKLHDFGYRGVSSEESAAIGGAAHLFNFMGTDTIAAIRLLQQYYGAYDQMPGFSIPASEHSTITSWGRDHEKDAYENMLDTYPEGLVACVSDSYDIRNAVSHIWGEQLRDKIMQRKGTLVIRPDSGNPVDVLRDIFTALQEKFGLDENATNRKGYRVLAPCVRVIQGDGVNYHTIQNMISILTREGWSMDNFAFGMGGALLQQLNRDTQKFAFKCSAIRINGEWHDVYKQPATDTTKNSKRGRLALTKYGDTFEDVTTVQLHGDEESTFADEMVTVFENGKVLVDYNVPGIRARLAACDTYEQDAAAGTKD